MNKKLKWTIPFAVLSLSCGIAAGVTGCNSAEQDHEHSYSEWKYNSEQHWKECPDDGAIDESTRGEHLFIGDECECGATKPSAPAATYGTVRGAVRLHRAGTYVADSDELNSISVDMGDDDVTVTKSVENGRLVFSISDIEVGKNYQLVVSKRGYRSYNMLIELEEEGEEVVIGGDVGVVLEYEPFGVLFFDPEYHDFSKVNDDNSVLLFKENDGTKTFNVITNDSYSDVSASMLIKYNNSSYSMRTQGIILKFEDGKHLVVRYHNGDMANGNIQYCNSLWELKALNSLFGSDANLNQYGENAVHTLTSEETAAIKDEGLNLKVVVSDGVLYTFFDGKWVATYELPEGYADKKVQVGYFAYNAVGNSVFSYEITETIPALASNLNIEVTKPEGVDCTVTVNPDKDTYEFGETVELSFTAPLGYKLDSLTVAGKERYNEVENGKITLTADVANIDVNAKFVQEQPIALNLAVKGKKLGSTSSLPAGAEVSFSGIADKFVVDGSGRISAGSVAKGRYTVSVNGYFAKEIVFDETLEEIIFEYDAFRSAMSWAPFDNSKQNDNEILGFTNDCGIILTNERYNDVATSIYLKPSGDGQLAALFRFVDDSGMSDGIGVRMTGTQYVEFYGDQFWAGDSHINDPYNGSWDKFYTFTTGDQYLEDYNAGTLKMTVYRSGATIYVFLNDTYVGKKTIDGKYADLKCEAGFLVGSHTKGQELSWRFEISDTKLPDLSVTVNDGTETDANGAISISNNVKFGDTVTIEVTPAQGYILDTITVTGATLTAAGDNVYTFVAAQKEHTVTATFKDMPANPASADITGIGLNNSSVDMEGKTVVFTPDGGAERSLVVENGKIEGVLAAGEYTVSCAGFYDLTATVGDDGNFAESTSLAFVKKVFSFNFRHDNGTYEPEANLGDKTNVGDSTKVAKDGVIKATGDGKIYEWTDDLYDGDYAITATLKSGNGNQGLIVAFGDTQSVVRLRFEGEKAQWIGGGWWWGTNHINDRWDFGSGEDYANPMNEALLAKYNGEGLTLTLARKGGMVYAIIDGKIYAAQSVSNFATSQIRFGVFAEDAKNGYEILIKLEETDAVLAKAGVAVGTDLIAYGGTWTEDSAAKTLKVSGRGYAEFKAEANTVKESVTIKIKGDVGGDQGIMYRFADGKYIAVRYQENGGSYKVQYTMDTLLFNDGSLKNWTDFMMTDEEKTEFDASGLDLTFIRDGATFYTYLGDRLLDTAQLEDKYAKMSGAMGIMIWEGNDVAFAYEYKSGENVTVPTTPAA